MKYLLYVQQKEHSFKIIYIGITISDNMELGQHIPEISSKATKTLGFPRRNFALAPRSTKLAAYKTLVWPIIECTTPIWCTYSKLMIKQVEIVQRTAACWNSRRWRNTVASANA